MTIIFWFPLKLFNFLIQLMHDYNKARYPSSPYTVLSKRTSLILHMRPFYANQLLMDQTEMDLNITRVRSSYKSILIAQLFSY